MIARRLFRGALLALATLAILGVTSPRAEARRKTARHYRFDGFKLGTNFAKLWKRAPYKHACDNDPVDNRKRRAMVYGALPCRRRVFPEKTTVVIFLKMLPNPSHRYALPIVALAFVHGKYFKKRSTFPVHPGDKLKKARRKFGKPLGKIILRARRVPPLTAYRFRGNIHILAEGPLVRGVVVGPMPRSPKNEQWRAIMQMVRRYTPLSGRPPAKPKGLGGLCAKLWKRSVACYKTSRLARTMIVDPMRFARRCKRKVGDPDDKAIIRCMGRARTCKALERCAKRR